MPQETCHVTESWVSISEPGGAGHGTIFLLDRHNLIRFDSLRRGRSGPFYAGRPFDGVRGASDHVLEVKRRHRGRVVAAVLADGAGCSLTSARRGIDSRPAARWPSGGAVSRPGLPYPACDRRP